MKIFAINLPSRLDKRTAIQKEGEAYGLSMEIIDAVNGKALGDTEISSLVYDYPACSLNKGVIGCSLSHLKVYKKMVDENVPIALILEDDAILHKDLAAVLEDLERIDHNESPEVYLLSSHYYQPKPLLEIRNGYSIHNFKDGSAAHGYVINLKAAQSLYESLRPIKWEADKWYYFQQMGLSFIRCVVPHLIDANDGPSHSDLYAERTPLNKKRRKYLGKLKSVVGLRERISKLLWKIYKRPLQKKS